MQSRMSKYYNSDEQNSENEDRVLISRSNKNKELYKEVGNLEIENYDSNNNYSVIGTANSEIDIDKIKDMLDKKYKEEPKSKSIGDATQIDLPEIKLDETREYDINVILKKAKEQKEINYEEERKMKLRNTQYDILKNLDIDGHDDEEEEEDSLEELKEEEKKKAKEDKLKELIDEVETSEETEEDTDLALDILSDLRGDADDTKEIGALEMEEEDLEKSKANTKILETKDIPKELFEETDEFTRTDIISNEEESDDEEEEETEEIDTVELDTAELDTTELDTTELDTKDMSFTDKDMFKTEDFEDFADIKSKSGILIKILVLIIVIAILAIIVYFVNDKLNLGLF
ncbi:MAG: hypothetical protein IKQ29_02430 [Bacilli bacterium]|nr:hypothetical protein [Bacilli bacterium]